MDRIFNLVCCGNVDDGKSTLLGRILLMTQSVKKDQLADALKASQKNGSDVLEPSMLLDGLLGEREQQITIDIAHRYFDYQNIRFHLLDCPGHEQYTANMAIGAAVADAALIVIDCTKGLMPQTRRHIEICRLFGIRRFCICLTKIDLIASADGGLPDQNKLTGLSDEISSYLSSFNGTYDILAVSALSGLNMDVLFETLVRYATAPITSVPNKIMHVQSSVFYQGNRYYYARVIGKAPVCGEQFILYEQNKSQTKTVTISAVHGYGCFELQEKIDIERGDCLSLQPLIQTTTPVCQIIWFDTPTGDMFIKHGTRTARIISALNEPVCLDRSVVISNIEDVRQNAYALIIDNTSKKTIGCLVFCSNAEEQVLTAAGRCSTVSFSSDLRQALGPELMARVAAELAEQGIVLQEK